MDARHFACAWVLQRGHDMLVPIFSALGIMLVLEGVMPFLSPRGFRRTLVVVTQSDDRTLRIAGLASMLAGVLLLYLARSA